MAFKAATKQAARLRTALYGPAGSGKTYSALRIASGIGGRIALIDTERGTASKYSDLFNFDVQELEDFTLESYMRAIDEAVEGGYRVLIIDSLSHAWPELLAEIEVLANTSFKGNTWAAWSKGTPRQQKFIDKILKAPLHVIATMRAKTEWSQDGGDRGKPRRVGMAPVQGKGIEFEFDQLIQLSADNTALVEKDRSGKFQFKVLQQLDERFGSDLASWLATTKQPAAGGTDAPAPAPAAGKDASGGPPPREQPGNNGQAWPHEGTAQVRVETVVALRGSADSFAVRCVHPVHGVAFLRLQAFDGSKEPTKVAEALRAAMSAARGPATATLSWRRNGSVLDLVDHQPSKQLASPDSDLEEYFNEEAAK